MPDDTGKLSTTEQDEVIKWISHRVGGGVVQCPLCRSQEKFEVGDQLVAPAPITPKGQVSNVQTYPLVTLICRACQHVSFLNVKGII